MTTVEQIIHALHGQESDFGRADTSKPNYANARGPMQVTDKLFKGLQQTGVIPADWSHANPDHTTEAARRHVKALYDKFAGDPRKVAAAYYAGEKAVTSDGSIVDFKDLEGERRFAAGLTKYKPPSTLEYVDKVAKRLGVPGRAPVARTPQPAVDPAKDFENLRAGVVPGAPIAAPVGPAGALPMGSPVVAPVDAGSQAVTAANQGQLARDQIIAQEGRGGAFGLAVEQSFGVQLMERLFRDEAEPDGTVASPEELRKARTGQEALDLQAAQSVAERNAVRFRNDEREYANRAMSEFPVAALVGSAMDPVAFAAGFGVSGALAKAGIGSMVLRQASKPLASVASTLGENVGVNVALEGGLQALQGEIRPEDLAAAAIVGGVLSAPGAIMNYRGATQAADQAAMRAAEAEVLRQEQAVIATAQSRLGASAGPVELAAEVSRVRREGMDALVSDAAGPIDQGRRILPREDVATAPSPFEDPPEDVVVAAPGTRYMATQGPAALAGPALPTPGEMDAWHRLSPARLSRDAKRDANRAMLEQTMGRTIEDAEALPPGVHMDASSATNVVHTKMAATAEYLRAKFMPEQRIIFRPDFDMAANGHPATNAGFFLRTGKDVVVIALGRGNQKPRTTLVHEIGHAVLVANWAKASPSIRAAMAKWHEDYLVRYAKSGGPDAAGMTPAMRAAAERGLPDYSFNRVDELSGASFLDQLTARAGDSARTYFPDFDEMGAEQFRKYLAAGIERGDSMFADAPIVLLNWVKDMWARFTRLFQLAKREGLLDADTSFREFFKQAARNAEAFRAGGGFRPAGTDGTVRPMRLAGIEALPDETPADRAQKKALRHLHEKAAKWAVENPKDAKWDERADRIIAKAPALMSSSLTLLRSENPVARMLAAELLEDASGVLGKRQATAAISKHVLERAFMGNAVNEVEDAYNLYAGMSAWRRVVGDLGNGQKRAEFNELVAAEIEARGVGKTGNVGPQRSPILAAADAIEGAFERMRQEQIRAEVLGFANLPDTSRGYLPHRLNQAKLAAATELERQGLRQMMVDQFMTIEGWDEAFSRDLAGRYVDAVRHRSMGGYDAPVTLGFGGSMDVVREALEAAGLTPSEINARVEQLSVGAAGHTKSRIRLDINKTYLINGQAVNLRQFFDTDPLNLVRSQAMRVSGEVALARFGVHGRPGLDLLRKSLEYGNGAATPSPQPGMRRLYHGGAQPDGGSRWWSTNRDYAEGYAKKSDSPVWYRDVPEADYQKLGGGDPEFGVLPAPNVQMRSEGAQKFLGGAVYPNATADELKAFTQIAAEFLGVPVEGRGPSLFLERARGLTALVKLGGAVWNQVGEITNVVASIGAARSFEFVRDLPRMRSEILALARGEKNTNPILGSLEQLRDGVGGAEFGLDAYKLAMPYDRQDFHNPAYRADEVTLVDRLIRGGGHLQAKLSLFRAVHSAQVRGTAEHMVRMFAEYTRTGRDAVALDQAGFSEVSKSLRASGDFDRAFKFDANGRLTEVDVGMIENLADREAFVSSVHRAAQQIIQGTFIGETGRWVHDDVLKTMLQFRAFSITAVEKQWGRQRNSRGLAATLGLMLGTMSIAAPIYMLRTYLASIGREDQEEYLERRLSMYEIGKNTMNYIALSGLAPDFLEVAGAIAPEDFRESLGMPAGGRYGAGGTAIGGLVAPSAGLANDAWNLLKEPSFDAAGKILPMSRLPALVPALNALGE